MVEKLGIDESKSADMCNVLYKNYGTTMAGLRVWFDYSLAFSKHPKFMGFSQIVSLFCSAGHWL